MICLTRTKAAGPGFPASWAAGFEAAVLRRAYVFPPIVLFHRLPLSWDNLDKTHTKRAPLVP